MDGVGSLVDDLEKVLSSEEPLRTNLLHVDSMWAMQSPTSAADWLSRLQRKDKEIKELEMLVRACVRAYMCLWVGGTYVLAMYLFPDHLPIDLNGCNFDMCLVIRGIHPN